MRYTLTQEDDGLYCSDGKTYAPITKDMVRDITLLRPFCKPMLKELIENLYNETARLNIRGTKFLVGDGCIRGQVIDMDNPDFEYTLLGLSTWVGENNINIKSTGDYILNINNVSKKEVIVGIRSKGLFINIRINKLENNTRLALTLLNKGSIQEGYIHLSKDVLSQMRKLKIPDSYISIDEINNGTLTSLDFVNEKTRGARITAKGVYIKGAEADLGIFQYDRKFKYNEIRLYYNTKVKGLKQFIKRKGTAIKVMCFGQETFDSFYNEFKDLDTDKVACSITFVFYQCTKGSIKDKRIRKVAHTYMVELVKSVY